MNRGIVSGYWNPIHVGHIEYIQAARMKCDHLIAIVNNDRQVQIKGSREFMDEIHRSHILSALRDVDDVLISIDTDKTVCASLRFLREKYSDGELSFFNSGDRVGEDRIESEEVKLCKKLGIKYVEIPLPKVYSSSTLLSKIS
jgi:cytidyltransferase-like protein